MIYVIDKYETGAQIMKSEDGKEIAYNNLHLFVISDEVPSTRNDGDTKYVTQEIKIKVTGLERIGFTEFSELKDRCVAFGYNLFGSKPTINSIRLLPPGTSSLEGLLL